ncbi:MAG: hypothetical protein COW48_10300 [Hydrogenophilales bacterium CG17_big_fil_post_rev_8_21_14_2_50_63_12]|nr:MAG: hypothetical protein COW48_10300 [Hydrogenophilales bacterium CG17_big_fil_post_rev_8_21_14_2_50_63_12]
MMMELTGAQLNFNRSLFDWCLRNAERTHAIGHKIQSARWCQLAGKLAGFGCGMLVSHELEALLLKLAADIKTTMPWQPSQAGTRRWLHVMTRTDSIGGHNALLKRWIHANPLGERHSIAVLEYLDPEETELHAAVRQTGGEFFSLVEYADTPLECARNLRELAHAQADVIVLHHHMWDVIPTIAFGVADCPPVLLLNMADHLFWVGAAISDMVLQIRPEGTELTREFRGVDRSHLLNIPLPEKPTADATAVDVRKTLGIPEDACVYLTLGRESKYEPREGIDFLATAGKIIDTVPGAYLIAIGPSRNNPAWDRAFRESEGRIVAVGSQRALQGYFAAADIYLEGFPFGSLTALLEAGLAGLPCVRAPDFLPPIYRSNGPAIDHIQPPVSTDGYVEQARLLALRPPVERKQIGCELSGKVEKYHCAGWSEGLKRLPIPAAHKLHPSTAATTALPLDDAKLLRWSEGDAMSYAAWYARRNAMNVKMDPPLLLACLRGLPSLDRTLALFRSIFFPPTVQPVIKGIT